MYEASHISVNDDTIRLVTNHIGKLVFKEDCKKVENLFQKYDTGRLEYVKARKGVLYIETDGAALNTRYKDEDSSTWRENKLDVVFSSDNIHFYTDKDVEKQQRILKW